MQKIFLVVPAMLLAGCTAMQVERRPDALDPGAKVLSTEFRSAFEGYRPLAEPELEDWRKANEEVGRAAAGHGGHK